MTYAQSLYRYLVVWLDRTPAEARAEIAKLLAREPESQET